MRVYIGPYVNWVGPYQIADWLQFLGVSEERCRKIGEFLSHTWLADVCQWIHSKQKRTIDVQLHNYDAWSLDHTLSFIILPGLKLLKEHKHGAPLVDDEDVPDELKSTAAPPKENEWDVDANHFKRWDWVLDEMIFAFEKKIHDDWDEEFWRGEVGEMQFLDTDETSPNPITGKLEKLKEVKFIGSTRECDWAGREKMAKRISNGFRLFGKYYEGLWD